MNFRIGQKVVCVDMSGIGTHDPAYKELPIVGHVYTVAGFHCRQPNSIFFEELNNPDPDSGRQCCFWAWRFRPIVERKTDISAFTKLLETKKVFA